MSNQLIGGNMRKPAIRKIPTEVMEQLKKSLRESDYGDYQGHSDWLKSIGYNISKSALHRFGRKLEAADEPPKSPEEWATMDLRMRALEVAVQLNPNPDELLQQAEELLDWVA